MERGNFVIILVEPGSPGNIGASLRAMKNMGFTRMRLVNPADWRDGGSYRREIERMAWDASDLLEGVLRYEDLGEAVSDLHWVVGTSAQRRRIRESVSLPAVVSDLVGKAAEQQVGLVFGPEKRGLSLSEISVCQQVLRIPTSDLYSTLNLSQAVLLVCYQLHLALAEPGEERIEWARQEEVQALYAHAREVLLEIGFLNIQNPDHGLEIFRKILSRSGLTPGEVRTLRGLMRQVSWASRRYRPLIW